jgi:hypothetical protein
MEQPILVRPVPGEPLVTDSHGTRWEYVFDAEDGHHKYLHRACDAVCDREGYCIMCGAPSPILWTSLPRGSCTDRRVW